MNAGFQLRAVTAAAYDVHRMKNILLLYCHPSPHKSRYNRTLLDVARALPFVKVRDLYELYPNLMIDETREQEALRAADALVMQFPLYWFSTPSMLKEWQDSVLINGFAFGEGGTALQGKKFMAAVSTGAEESAYASGESHGAPVAQYLAPIEMTARFCGMEVVPAFVAHNARHQAFEATKMQAHDYCNRLSTLVEDA